MSATNITVKMKPEATTGMGGSLQLSITNEARKFMLPNAIEAMSSRILNFCGKEKMLTCT
jgi:hypothetical protein